MSHNALHKADDVTLSTLLLPDGRIVSERWILSQEGQSELQLLREEGLRIKCLCKSFNKGEALLFVRRLEGGVFTIARMPNTQNEHDPECRSGKERHRNFHTDDGSLTGYVEHEDGSYEIYPQFLLDKTKRDVALEKVGSERRTDDKQFKIISTLVGVLKLLWEKASLNKHFTESGTRGWNKSAYFLRKALEKGRLRGRDMKKVVYVPMWQKDNGHNNDFWNWADGLAKPESEGNIGIVIAPIIYINQASNGSNMEVRVDSIPAYIQISEAARQTLHKTYPTLTDKLQTIYGAKNDITLRKNRDDEIVGAFLVTNSIRKDDDGNSKRCLIARQFVLMRTTKTYVPIESDDELHMAKALIEAGRAYIKPIIHEDSSSMLPDFMIIDQKPAIFIEVLSDKGDADYAKHKQSKLDYYHRANKQIITWDAANGDPIPAISKKGH
jgi:hypothetical protein